jgi:hypothetical protein
MVFALSRGERGWMVLFIDQSLSLWEREVG